MMLIAGLISLLALATPTLPFPPPYVGPISADAKFASGPIISIDPAGKNVSINTLVGPLKIIVEPASRILGVDSKPIVLTTDLKPGTYVRLYFVLRDGPRLEELDQLPMRMR